MPVCIRSAAAPSWRARNDVKTMRKGESLPRCFGFRFVTMAAATTSCQCGSSCAHSFLRSGSRSLTELCLHCHIWAPVNNKHRASPKVKTGMKRCPRAHVHVDTDTHTRPLTCSSQAFKTLAICTQLSLITVNGMSSRYANVEGGEGAGPGGRALGVIKQI